MLVLINSNCTVFFFTAIFSAEGLGLTDVLEEGILFIGKFSVGIDPGISVLRFSSK